jgi:hypothetical protein
MATNPYYQRAFFALQGTLARARQMVNEFALIQRGFDQLGNVQAQKEYQLACSDLATSLQASVFAAYFRNSVPLEIVSVTASLSQASSSGPVEVSATVNGVPLFLTNITIDEGETTSTTAAVQPVLALNSIPAHSEFVIAIENGGTGARGLIFSLLGRIGGV